MMHSGHIAEYIYVGSKLPIEELRIHKLDPCCDEMKERSQN